MEYHRLPFKAGRVLRADGDGLAYYCAGSDNTDPAQARLSLEQKVRAAKDLSGSEHVQILLTDRGSHKGHRYAVATVKAYQGQRVNSRRPKNWAFLRSILEEGRVPGAEVITTKIAEADDLFGLLTREDDVIFTQDKDMRMLPGIHMDWDSHRMFHLRPDVHGAIWDGEVYGRRWFWLQMLQGDSADFIPGLEWVVRNGKKARCGKVTAEEILSWCINELDCRQAVIDAYESYYGQDWPHRFCEQAILLWMRRKTLAWDDVFAPGHPLQLMRDSAAREIIATRIKEVESYAQAQDQ
jgi:DNA polymerase-1